MRVCIASWVFLSSLASFFSISRFKSQFGRLGAMLKTSWGHGSVDVWKADKQHLPVPVLFYVRLVL